MWLAVYPLVAGGRRTGEPPAEERELEAEKDRLVLELHELELDRATGKLSEEDYRALEARLKRRAVNALEEIDAARARAGGGDPPPRG